MCMSGRGGDYERLIEVAYAIRLLHGFVSELFVTEREYLRPQTYEQIGHQLAVDRLAEIILDEAARLSDETRERVGIGWPRAAYMRNVYEHTDGNVTRDDVWPAIQYELPGLLAAVEGCIGEIERGKYVPSYGSCSKETEARQKDSVRKAPER